MRKPRTILVLGAVVLFSLAALTQAKETPTRNYIPTDAERARWTMADLRTLAIAIDAYHIDKETYPDGTEIEDVLAIIEPNYVRKAPLKDAWGTTFKYTVSPDHASYTIVSAGADLRFDNTTWSRPGEFDGYGEDVVVQNGEFVRTWAYR